MLRIRALSIPEIYPSPEAIKSFQDNKHGYDPEFWEFQYETYRYIGRLPDESLRIRYRDILNNMQALTSPDRHIIPIQSFLSSWYWYRKEHQTRLEFLIRGLELPNQPPLIISSNSTDAGPVRPRSPNAGDVLYRYGNNQYMTEMIEQGSIRISSASEVQKLDQDIARYDRELNKQSYMPGQYTRITTQDGVDIPVIGDVCRTVSLPNYFFLCISLDWDFNLFKAFGADTCVVIKNPNAFEKRLEEASKQKLPGWELHHFPVEYYDPYERLPNQRITAGMSKDFCYAYQREYRFIWIHKDGLEAKGFKFLNVGSIEDIAELIKL